MILFFSGCIFKEIREKDRWRNLSHLPSLNPSSRNWSKPPPKRSFSSPAKRTKMDHTGVRIVRPSNYSIPSSNRRRRLPTCPTSSSSPGTGPPGRIPRIKWENIRHCWWNLSPLWGCSMAKNSFADWSRMRYWITHNVHSSMNDQSNK